MASIVGATAGTQDLESGVFRDLAATGRARGALFGARFAGALGVTLPVTALTAAMLAAGSLLLADGTPLPHAGDILAATGLLVAAAVLATAAGVGAGALFGSRGPVIGLLLGFFLVIDPLLASIGFLGEARAIVPSEALHRIGGMPRPDAPRRRHCDRCRRRLGCRGPRSRRMAHPAPRGLGEARPHSWTGRE